MRLPKRLRGPSDPVDRRSLGGGQAIGRGWGSGFSANVGCGTKRASPRVGDNAILNNIIGLNVAGGCGCRTSCTDLCCCRQRATLLHQFLEHNLRPAICEAELLPVIGRGADQEAIVLIAKVLQLPHTHISAAGTTVIVAAAWGPAVVGRGEREGKLFANVGGAIFPICDRAESQSIRQRSCLNDAKWRIALTGVSARTSVSQSDRVSRSGVVIETFRMVSPTR